MRGCGAGLIVSVARQWWKAAEVEAQGKLRLPIRPSHRAAKRDTAVLKRYLKTCIQVLLLPANDLGLVATHCGSLWDEVAKTG
jgi:hypothetical protein